MNRFTWRANHQCHSKNTGERGWTLIELIVAIAIVAILTSIAIPSYNQSIMASRRAAAQTALLALQLQQQAYRQTHNSYAGNSALQLPASAFYRFSVSNASNTGYLLVATAKGSQRNDLQCSTMTLDHSFTRLPADCWQ